MEDALKEAEVQSIYESTLRDYLAMFSEMDPKQRATWFFVMEESLLLSVPIGPGQSLQEASAVHAARLTAIADALAAKPNAKGDEAMVNELHRLSQFHSP